MELSALRGTISAAPFPTAWSRGKSTASPLAPRRPSAASASSPIRKLLADAIGLPVINMGVAGAGPEYFLTDRHLIECMNRARFVILQVMSATSQSNSTYECGGLSTCTLRRDGRHLPIGTVFEELLAGGHPALAALPLPARVRRKIGNLAHRRSARALVAELRAGWVASSLELLRRIEAPVVLLSVLQAEACLQGKLRFAAQALRRDPGTPHHP